MSNIKGVEQQTKSKYNEPHVENVLVGLRLRPTDSNDKICNIVNEKSVIVKKSNERFSFDNVFDEAASSKDIFTKMVQPIVQKCLLGYNGSICAYGQTSSGKTYTMKGSNKEPGLIQLSIDYLLQSINKITDTFSNLKISYIEIYNENIYDLLIRDLQEMKPNTSNEYKWETINSLIQFEEIFKLGEEQRHFGETKMNDNSSRSHVILQIAIETRQKCPPFIIRNSYLHLVDLAGSEGLSKTQAEGLRRKEGFLINKSLLALQNVVSKLKENKKDQFVNFRDSKLTKILKPSLNGNSLTVMLLTISQNNENYLESVNTMRFGMSAGALKNTVNPNEIQESNSFQNEAYNEMIEQVENYQTQLQEIQQQLDFYKNQSVDEQNTIRQIKELVMEKNILIEDQLKTITEQNIEKQRLQDQIYQLQRCNQELISTSNENSNYLNYFRNIVETKGVLNPKLMVECITQTDNCEAEQQIKVLEQENVSLKQQISEMKNKFSYEIQDVKDMVSGIKKNKEFTPAKKLKFQSNKDLNGQNENQKEAKTWLQKSLQKTNQYLESLNLLTTLQTQLIEQTKQNMILRNFLDKKELEYTELERANFVLHKSIFDLQEKLSEIQNDDKKENAWRMNSEKSNKQESLIKKRERQRLYQSPTKDELKRNLFRQEQRNQIYEKELNKYMKNLDQISKQKQELQQFSHHLYMACIENNIQI
ncbi:unnamed protein product [Paramecium octaurelia]|uniref:Kinesin motor domain-containing protein n=1 Tax=Paramecium octaurelia TaxID=43137 RepID=A0A8S1UE44_PAROT|nr:unnamed protein product [Paramecium octaurelia]